MNALIPLTLGGFAYAMKRYRRNNAKLAAALKIQSTWRMKMDCDKVKLIKNIHNKIHNKNIDVIDDNSCQLEDDKDDMFLENTRNEIKSRNKNRYKARRKKRNQ